MRLPTEICRQIYFHTIQPDLIFSTSESYKILYPDDVAKLQSYILPFGLSRSKAQVAFTCRLEVRLRAVNHTIREEFEDLMKDHETKDLV